MKTNGQFTIQVRLSEALNHALRVPVTYATRASAEGEVLDGVFQQAFLAIPAGAVL